MDKIVKISHLALFDCLLADLSMYVDGAISSFEDAAAAPYFTDMTYKQYASLSLLKSSLKKFKDGVSKDADTAAYKKFLASNLRCKNWSLSQVNTSLDEELIGTFKQRINDFFFKGGELIPDVLSVFNEARMGPGASIGSLGTDSYTKLFAGPFTYTTEHLLALYQLHCRRDERSAAAEMLRSGRFGAQDRVVEGNKLSFVPKNVNTSRSICTEPSLNMFYQLGTGSLLAKGLRRSFGIDLSEQPRINRDMAQIGSKLDNLCTIDLESASDSISLGMIKECFPADIVSWLMLLRSPRTIFRKEGHELFMLSSMGNGYTFPIQTVIFSCVVSSVYASLGIRMRRSRGEHLGNFGVFGDDIIVVKKAYPRVCRLLTLLGFTVNEEKSFSEGPFRESCGGDFFLGRSCRGVYIKSLRSQSSRCVAINRLNAWSAMTGIQLPSTVSYLLKGTRFLPVPLYENDDAGIKVPFHCIQGLRRDKDVQSVMYRRHEPIIRYLRIRDGDIASPRGAKKRYYNPDGLLLSFLRGDIVSDRISVRLGAARYKTKWAISPNWDWLPETGYQPGVSQLAAAIVANMY